MSSQLWFHEKKWESKVVYFWRENCYFFQLTYSIMSVESQRCLANFQCKPNLWYKWEFSQSSNFSSWWRFWKAKMINLGKKERKIFLVLTLLDRQMTGHIEHPKVQQQHRQPQNSQRTLIGRFFRNVWLTRVTVALNSSGATRACNPEGNSVSKRLDKPNLLSKNMFG